MRQIGLFGSYTRGEQTSISDVDILVELERPIGWEIVDLHRYLEALAVVRNGVCCSPCWPTWSKGVGKVARGVMSGGEPSLPLPGITLGEVHVFQTGTEQGGRP